MMTGRRVAVLGATGSIGLATVEVIERLGPPWRVHAISAHRQIDALCRIAHQTHAARVIISSSPPTAAARPAGRWPPGALISTGPRALVAAATDPDVETVVAAIVGRAGVESTVAAIGAGKRVALANKETLVCAGPVVAGLLAGAPSDSGTTLGDATVGGTTLGDATVGGTTVGGTTVGGTTVGGTTVGGTTLGGTTLGGPGALAGPRLLPVDSEHSAIFQCLAAGPGNPHRLILTASGGPFRDWSIAQMREATVQQALRHPTWKMGRKITIDSATMMNKALEIIEARWLFDVRSEALEVVVHPQSVIHSMVEFADGSVVAQMSPPDMRLPIQYALTYPTRCEGPAPRLDRTKRWDLTLQPVDQEQFPAIPLGFEVAGAGGTAGSVVNAANEAAVDLFLNGQIRFTDIVPACRTVLEHHTFDARPTLERLLELDEWARAEVRRWSCRATV